jgi:hypothetical protein
VLKDLVLKPLLGVEAQVTIVARVVVLASERHANKILALYSKFKVRLLEVLEQSSLAVICRR